MYIKTISLQTCNIPALNALNPDQEHVQPMITMLLIILGKDKFLAFK